MIIITIPKIVEATSILFFKSIMAGLPKNLIKYATIKKRTPLPSAEIKMNAIKFTPAIPLVNVMIL